MSLNADKQTLHEPQRYCFCADGRYVDFIVPAVESIAKSGASGTKFSVDIIVDKEPKVGVLGALKALCSGDVTVHVIDPAQFGDLLEVTHISRGMYYRLLIPELLDADKVLYLDCDVLVRHSLSDLFNTDLEGVLAGAVINPFYDGSRLGLADGDRYFNSGVLLLNCAEWRADGTKDKVLAYLRDNTDLLRMPDQDALNAVLRGRWRELDPTYNCQVSMLLRHKELAAELAPGWSMSFLESPAIMHFSSAHKQWHASNRIVFSKEYRQLRTHIMEPRRGPFLDFVIGRIRQAKFAIGQSNPYFY